MRSATLLPVSAAVLLGLKIRAVILVATPSPKTKARTRSRLDGRGLPPTDARGIWSCVYSRRFPAAFAAAVVCLLGLVACSSGPAGGDKPDIGSTSTAFSHAPGSAPKVTFAAGSYYTVQGRNTNDCLDASTSSPAAVRCQANSSSGWWTQEWELSPVGTDANGALLYTIQNRTTGQCLTTVSSTAFAFAACGSQLSMSWYVQAVDAVNYLIASASSGHCLSSDTSINDGALTAESCNPNYWSEHWQFLPAQSISLTFRPYIATDCFFYSAPAPDYLRAPVPQSANCVPGSNDGSRPLAWLVSSNSESWGSYVPSNPDQIDGSLIGAGNVWNPVFQPVGDGTYRLDMSLDKYDYLYDEDYFTFVSFGDNFDVNAPGEPYPNLGSALYADFDLSLIAHQEMPGNDDTVNGPTGGMSRVMLGAEVTWNGVSHFMEVVLWRSSDAYDGCGTTPASDWWGTPCGGANAASCAIECDATGLYDRRFFWNSGEAVYYYAPALNSLLGYVIPPLDAAGLGSMLSYRIPVSQLVEAYPWTSGGPNSWSEATVHGIYIGIEVWGPASVSTELSNYRLYSVGVGN